MQKWQITFVDDHGQKTVEEGVYRIGMFLIRNVALVAVPKPVAGFNVMLLPLSCQALLSGSQVVYVPDQDRHRPC
ncbi:hypothetical protein, partial [Klebsiella pneumoniae]|uniref:hypothetical protein n=1 Tax=Klebsiella pneumoniae TaxID=573 RepID=UPI00272F8002